MPFQKRLSVAVCLSLAPLVASAQVRLDQPTPKNQRVDDVVSAPIDSIPEGAVLIEGDILIPAEFYDAGSISATFATNLWPGGVVPYQFDANVSATNQTRMLEAMDEWMIVANISFIPRSGQSNYVHVQSSTGNNSYVGRIGGGQVINIVSWSSKYIIVHELGHALGYWHEQSRSDRGAYVTINGGNIQSGYSGNFSIQPGSGTFGPYDFESVMHYTGCSFSTCCPPGTTCNCPSGCETITALPPYEAYQNAMGQRTHLSDGDVGGMAYLYGGPNCTPVDAPLAPASVTATNRFLAFEDGNAGARTAVRVTFDALPPPYDLWNGVTMWVGTPTSVSELGCCDDLTPPTFVVAALQCDPYFAAWDEFGTVHVYHEGIVPGGQYLMQAVSNSCNTADPASFSTELVAVTSDWADVVGAFDVGSGTWSAPNGSVDVAADVVAILNKFSSLPGSPEKVRVDIEPATPDLVINITDVTVALDAFAGGTYPFSVSAPPCGP